MSCLLRVNILSVAYLGVVLLHKNRALCCLAQPPCFISITSVAVLGLGKLNKTRQRVCQGPPLRKTHTRSTSQSLPVLPRPSFNTGWSCVRFASRSAGGDTDSPARRPLQRSTGRLGDPVLRLSDAYKNLWPPGRTNWRLFAPISPFCW